jgi:two-component sensor histidine kinase
LALFLSVVLFWWAFVPPAYSFALTTLVDALNVLLFAGAGLAVIWISQLYRRALLELRAERAKSELLLGELAHRAKNGIAVISTIVKHSLRHDPEAADKIIGRIMTLKKADDLLLAENQSSLGLEDLLQRELSSYDLSRVDLSGPRTELKGDLVKTFSMVVHELATNAAKYGAWSVPGGTIDIRWGSSAGQTSFEWEERGCPPLPEPPQPGFGSVMVGRLLALHHGRADFERRPSGVYWRLTLPEAMGVS